MHKIIIASLIFIAAVFALFYFELPFNLLKPVFHKDTVDTYSRQYGMDPLLISAMIKVESNFARLARSHSGAVGLMQLMPSTAKELAEELEIKGFDIKDLENPDTNIRLGAYYISQLQKEFRGSLPLALAAYNAGKGKVQSWYLQNPLIEIEISDIPYKETRNYVDAVTKTYRWLKLLKEFKNLIRGRV